MLWSVCDMFDCVFASFQCPPLLKYWSPPSTVLCRRGLLISVSPSPALPKVPYYHLLAFSSQTRITTKCKWKHVCSYWSNKQGKGLWFRVLPVKRTFWLPTFPKWLFIGICQPFSLLLSGLWLSIWRWRLLWFAAIKISKLYWTEGPGQLVSPAPVRVNDKVHAPVWCIY